MTQQPHPGDAYQPTASQPHPVPQQWASPEGQPHPTAVPQPPARNTRKPLLYAGIAALVTFVVLGVGGYAVYDQFIREDTGVAACKAMRDGKNADGSEDAGEDAKMTEAQYRQARKVFEDSRHEDIREHGTALMDLAWQINQMPEGEEMGALAFIGPMGTHVSGLQTACADQGVIVNLNSK